MESYYLPICAVHLCFVYLSHFKFFENRIRWAYSGQVSSDPLKSYQHEETGLSSIATSISSSPNIDGSRKAQLLRLANAIL